jgi:hypothetical protein
VVGVGEHSPCLKTVRKDEKMIENIIKNKSPEIIGYVKEVEFTKNGVAYWGMLRWELGEGFDFFPRSATEPELTYDEMLFIDEQTGEV